MDPIPKRWKGICQHGDGFNSSHCNKKIIGARFYLNGLERRQGNSINRTNAPFRSLNSARDDDGHGTHTSSIVGGRMVPVNYKGYAQGTASGGAPLARLAMYKVCYDVCYDEDILAGFDDAIGDGVDILSMSLGAEDEDYLNNAIGPLHAVKHNIAVSSAAENKLRDGLVKFKSQPNPTQPGIIKTPIQPAKKIADWDGWGGLILKFSL